MDMETLLQGIRGRNEDASRELVRSRGVDALLHALALSDGDKPAARAIVSEAFRGAIAHVRAFPEQTFDEGEFSALLDAELIEAARRRFAPSVSDIASDEGWRTLRAEKAADEPAAKDEPDEPDESPPRRKPKRGRLIVQTLLLALCAALCLWVLCGILMSMGWMPYADLGYTWFNRNLFRIF